MTGSQAKHQRNYAVTVLLLAISYTKAKQRDMKAKSSGMFPHIF